MDADRYPIDPSTKDRLASWLRGQFSLDTPDQPLVSPETGGDITLSLVPGVGQAMAVRDIARGIKAGDATQTALAATGLIPFGKVLSKGAQKLGILANADSIQRPGIKDQILKYLRMEDEAGQAAHTREFRDYAWPETGIFRDPAQDLLAEIPDQGVKFKHGIWVPSSSYKDRFVLNPGSAEDILHHPELYKQLKDTGIKDMRIYGTIDPAERIEGTYNPSSGGRLGNIDIVATDVPSALETGLHELGHATQELTGLKGQGTSVGEMGGILAHTPGLSIREANRMGSEAYMRDLGEMNARAIERRAQFPTERNRLISPEADWDRTYNQAIISQYFAKPEARLALMDALRRGGPIPNDPLSQGWTNLHAPNP